MKRYQKDCASIPSLQGKPPRQAIHLSSGQTNSPCQKSWSPQENLILEKLPLHTFGGETPCRLISS